MSKGLRNWKNDYSDCPQEDKKRLLKAFFDENMKTDPSTSTRRQLQKAHESQQNARR